MNPTVPEANNVLILCENTILSQYILHILAAKNLGIRLSLGSSQILCRSLNCIIKLFIILTGSLEVMQTEISRLHADMASIKSDSLETLQSQIRGLQTDITTVQSSCRETMKTQISSLKTDMKTLTSLESIQMKISTMETDMASVKSNISGINRVKIYLNCNFQNCIFGHGHFVV